MSYCDTPEQAAIIGWSGHRLVVRAFAGTGKTSTLVRFAQANPNCKMLYLAYNRAVRDEAEQKFPFNVECKTSHQLAWPNFGRHYQQRLTANLRITDVARQLNTRHWPLARTSITTFNAFLCSGMANWVCNTCLRKTPAVVCRTIKSWQRRNCSGVSLHARTAFSLSPMTFTSSCISSRSPTFPGAGRLSF